MGQVSEIRAALLRRRRQLEAQTTCFRWIDGEIPSVTVDLFDDVAIMSCYREASTEEESALAQMLAEAAPLRAVYVKRRPVSAHGVAVDGERLAPKTPIWGSAVDACSCREQGLAFEIRPANGLSVGLYLDARDARAWVRRAAAGRSVLNTFSYTCGFGVAARLGGAASVTNVDVSRRVLDWGKVNWALNELSLGDGEFVAGDTFDWLGRWAKKGVQFDLVVLDPPGFSSTKASRFSLEKDYHRLIRATHPVLAPQALVLAMCNVASMSSAAFEGHLRRGFEGRAFRIVDRFGASSIDFNQPSALQCLVLEVPAPRRVGPSKRAGAEST